MRGSACLQRISGIEDLSRGSAFSILIQIRRVLWFDLADATTDRVSPWRGLHGGKGVTPRGGHLGVYEIDVVYVGHSCFRTSMRCHHWHFEIINIDVERFPVEALKRLVSGCIDLRAAFGDKIAIAF